YSERMNQNRALRKGWGTLGMVRDRRNDRESWATRPAVLLFSLQALHFTNGRLQMADPLPRRASPGCRLSRGCGFFLLTFCIQNAHLLARQLQMSFELVFAPEAVTARVGFDLGAVQRHPLQRDQSFATQHAEHLHK